MPKKRSSQHPPSHRPAIAPLPALAPITRQQIGILLALLATYLLTRLPNLTAWGLGYDETTYLYWGQVIGQDWSQRYIGAGWGGKQPLHAWLVAFSEMIFSDPVFAGRLVSVLTGGLALVGVWLLARRLYSPRVAAVASLLYIFTPYLFYYDRSVMIDSLLAAEATFLIYFSVRLALKPSRRPDWLAITGLALTFGAALLTKSISQAFVLLLPASLLALPRIHLTRDRLLAWLLSVAGGLAAGFVIYYLAFGGTDAAPLVAQFEQNYGRYTLSTTELLQFPWQTWGANLTDVAGWFWRGFTPLLALAALAALLASPWLGGGAWMLAAWVLLPSIGQIIIANRFYDRYILFSLPPLLILTAQACEQFYRKVLVKRWPFKAALIPWAGAALLGMILIPAGLRASQLAFADPFESESTHGWYGLYTLRDDLIQQASSQPITVLVNHSPSPVEDGLTALLRGQLNLRVLRLVPSSDGQYTLFDPYNRQAYPAASLEGQIVYYANLKDADTKSWLAGKVELVQLYPNWAGDPGTVGLYSVKLDASFR